MKNFVVVAAIVLAPVLTFGHARLTSPVPRNNNAGIKVGPCGNVPRTGVNTVWTVGQTVTVTWEETINHPGKFLFAISPANDQGFEQNMVKMVIDDQDGGNLPHLFSTTFVVPNIVCDNCTFQMIQSMEENPNNPTFYYSCADIRIQAAGGNSSQSSTSGNSNQNQGEFGGYGCGTIGSVPPPPGGSAPLSVAIMFLALATYALLRRSQRSLVFVPRKSRSDRAR